jgi:Cytochrome P460
MSRAALAQFERMPLKYDFQRQKECAMKRIAYLPITIIAVSFTALGGGAVFASNKDTVAVPNGLAFSEFKGYEDWQVISVSHQGLMAVILGNPAMINAYKAGSPGNGKPFPDGAKMAKIHWNPRKNETAPGQPLVAGTLHDIDFMVKDSKRFADSGGWGYGAFEYNAASDTFRPANADDTPPQANDAKCGFACHTVVTQQDYVFTEYPKR